SVIRLHQDHFVFRGADIPLEGDLQRGFEDGDKTIRSDAVISHGVERVNHSAVEAGSRDTGESASAVKVDNARGGKWTGKRAVRQNALRLRSKIAFHVRDAAAILRLQRTDQQQRSDHPQNVLAHLQL